MALTDGIGDVFRIRGVGEAASGYAFIRLRVRNRQSGQQSKEEHREEGRHASSQPELPEKDSEKHVDIQA